MPQTSDLPVQTATQHTFTPTTVYEHLWPEQGNRKVSDLAAGEDVSFQRKLSAQADFSEIERFHEKLTLEKRRNSYSSSREASKSVTVTEVKASGEIPETLVKHTKLSDSSVSSNVTDTSTLIDSSTRGSLSSVNDSEIMDTVVQNNNSIDGSTFQKRNAMKLVLSDQEQCRISQEVPENLSEYEGPPTPDHPPPSPHTAEQFLLESIRPQVGLSGKEIILLNIFLLPSCYGSGNVIDIN